MSVGVYHRAHPFTIVFNLGRVFYLIIIPVVRGLFSALQGGFYRWVRGAWLDILVLLLMLGIAVIAWLSVSFRYDGEEIEIRTGLWFCRKVFIPWKNVTAIVMVESFYLRPVHALRFRADTPGGSFKDADFSIFLSEKQAGAILVTRKDLASDYFGSIYHPTTLSIVALSLLTSNSFGGILFISTFISQSGKLLGNKFPDMIIGTFEQAARHLAFGIPPAAAAIGYMLIAGWFIGFLLSFIRYKNFTLTRKPNTLCINGGIFTKREYYIRYSDVNFIDIRQSIVTKLLRLHSLYISAVGYGKQKDDISCIIPTEQEKHFEKNREAIFPAMAPSPRQLAPEAKGIMRFIGLPCLLLLGIVSAVFVLPLLLPSWKAFIWFVGLMALVPAAFFLSIRILEFHTSGISFQDNNFTLRYSIGLSLHTVVIPADKVVCVELSQSFLQKFGRYCDLIISSKSEGRYHHRCRNLVKDDLNKLFNFY